MEPERSYKQRGTPDCPIEVYSSKTTPDHIRFTHWHPELELFCIKRGHSVYRMDKERIRVNPGQILVIPPGVIHGQQQFSPDMMGYSIVISPEAVTLPDNHIFQKEFVEPLQAGSLRLPYLLSPGEELHTALFPTMAALPKCKIYEEDYKLRRFTAAMTICLTLAAFCKKEGKIAPLPKGNPAVKECMRYIHRNYTDSLTIQSLADHVHLQPNYLCALFKEHTGQTVMEHLTQIRVNAAAFLLRNNDMAMSRVAELSGFHSESAFFRQFKNWMGVTPSVYQRNNKST